MVDDPLAVREHLRLVVRVDEQRDVDIFKLELRTCLYKATAHLGYELYASDQETAEETEDSLRQHQTFP